MFLEFHFADDKRDQTEHYQDLSGPKSEFFTQYYSWNLHRTVLIQCKQIPFFSSCWLAIFLGDPEDDALTLLGPGGPRWKPSTACTVRKSQGVSFGKHENDQWKYPVSSQSISVISASIVWYHMLSITISNFLPGVAGRRSWWGAGYGGKVRWFPLGHPNRWFISWKIPWKLGWFRDTPIWGKNYIWSPLHSQNQEETFAGRWTSYNLLHPLTSYTWHRWHPFADGFFAWNMGDMEFLPWLATNHPKSCGKFIYKFHKGDALNRNRSGGSKTLGLNDRGGRGCGNGWPSKGTIVEHGMEWGALFWDTPIWELLNVTKNVFIVRFWICQYVLLKHETWRDWHQIWRCHLPRSGLHRWYTTILGQWNIRTRGLALILTHRQAHRTRKSRVGDDDRHSSVFKGGGQQDPSTNVGVFSQDEPKPLVL